MTIELVCNRTACRVKLGTCHYKIWNDPSTNRPNVYCIQCGHKIIDYNPTLKFEVNLRGTT